jgi:hypothetical protein
MLINIPVTFRFCFSFLPVLYERTARKEGIFQVNASGKCGNPQLTSEVSIRDMIYKAERYLKVKISISVKPILPEKIVPLHLYFGKCLAGEVELKLKPKRDRGK